jgi:hypothetical protein
LHSNVDGATPQPGDFSICWECGGVGSYNEDLQLVGLTEEQLEDLESNISYRLGRMAWEKARTPKELGWIWGRLRRESK